MNIKEFLTENQLQVEHIKYFLGGGKDNIFFYLDYELIFLHQNNDIL